MPSRIALTEFHAFQGFLMEQVDIFSRNAGYRPLAFAE
jgi:hypothetical protein